MWSESDSFRALRREIDRIFQDFSPHLSSALAPTLSPVLTSQQPFGTRPASRAAVIPQAGLLGTPPPSGPAVNLWEDEANLFLEMELPGFSLEELEIAITENRLSLAASPKEETKSAEESPLKREPVYHRRERRALKFSRVVELPSAVKTEQADAVLKNGVLTVRLPKAESAKRRKIAVSTAS